jgi:hypothetical protein
MDYRFGTPRAVGKSSWGLAHPMSLTELAILDGRRPLPLWEVIGQTLSLILTNLEGVGIAQYSDWLRAGRPRGRSSSTGRFKNM